MARAHRKLVHLHPVDLALRGEEEHVIVRARDEEVLDEIVLAQVHALQALAAPLLLAVRGDRQSLHVTRARDRDDHVLFGDEVLDVEVLRCRGDRRAALVGELRADLGEFVLDDLQHEAHVGQHALEPVDLATKLSELLLDLVALEADETTQAHLEDRIGLGLRELEALHEARLGFDVGLGPADDLDDLVDVVQRNDVALEDVGALLGLSELVAGASDDHVLLMLDVGLEHLGQRHGARYPVVKREHDHAEAGLQRRVFVEFVEHDLRDRGLLELDDYAHALAVGLVAQVRDLRELLLAYEIRDLRDEFGLVHLVGDLGDDDPRASRRGLLDVRLPAHLERATTGR